MGKTKLKYDEPSEYNIPTNSTLDPMLAFL